MPKRKKRKDALLKNLGFSTQVLKIFEREGYQTIGDLFSLSASEFLEFSGAKERHLERIQEILPWYGYTEKDTDLLTTEVEKEAHRKSDPSSINTIVVYERYDRTRRFGNS